MEKPVKHITSGDQFVYEDKHYIKCYSTTVAIVPIRHQVLAVEIYTGKIISLFEDTLVNTVQ